MEREPATETQRPSASHPLPNLNHIHTDIVRVFRAFVEPILI